MRSLVMAACAAAGFVGSASAQSNYTTLYVFGDSLSDRGRIMDILREQMPAFPIDVPKSPPYFDHRFSNGPTWAERLPTLLGAAPNPAQNYAVGGAETNTNNLMNPELGMFGLSLPGIKSEIDTFSANGGKFSASAVVAHFGGANDYFAFLGAPGKPPAIDQAPAQVASVIGDIKANIQQLSGLGAKTFLVPNVPDLGVTPQYRGSSQQEIATALSAQHAAALNQQMGALASQTGSNIYVVDFYTALATALKNPSLFGFTNTTDACLPAADVRYPASLDPGTPCANPQSHLFWDPVHPTSVSHQLLSQYAADTLLAPTSLPIQAAASLTGADNFSRQMQRLLYWDAAAQAGGSSSEKPGVFLNVLGNRTQLDPGTGFVSGKYSSTQILGGGVTQLSPHVWLGAMAGFDTGRIAMSGSRGDIDLASYRVGAMASYDDRSLYASVGLAASRDEYDLTRQTFVPQLKSKSDFSGSSFSAVGNIGYRFAYGSAFVGPVLGARYNSVSIDSYTEAGSPGLDLIVERQKAEELIGSAGLAGSFDYMWGQTSVTPYARIAAERNLLSDGRTIWTALATVPDVRRYTQVSANQTVYGRGGAGVNFRLAPNIVGSLNAEATFGRSSGNERSIMLSIRARL